MVSKTRLQVLRSANTAGRLVVPIPASGGRHGSVDDRSQSEVELQQERAVVHRAIEALPDIQRETVLLYYMGDQSQARIASFLEISEGTVKKRLFDARATLKGSMISMVQDSLHEEAPSRTASFERRVVTSVLPLQVSVWEQPGDIARALGSTVAGRHVGIPENPTFLENSILPENSVLIVEPRLEIDDAAWDRLLGEMKERQIPGLCVEGRLSDRHLERMGELADQLVYLNLSGTNAGITDRGLSHLADLKRLRYLDVNQNGACNSPSLVPANVSDAGMSFLSELTDLEVLYLHNLFSVGDGTARHLKHLTRLRRLGFDATLITDQGLRYIAGHEHLIDLSLGPLITDAGLAVLRELPAFTDASRPGAKLSLAKCPFIGDEGLKHVGALAGLERL